MSDFVCILRHKKYGTVICGWLTAKQYLEAGYFLDWDATNKEIQAALSQPSEGICQHRWDSSVSGRAKCCDCGEWIMGAQREWKAADGSDTACSASAGRHVEVGSSPAHHASNQPVSQPSVDGFDYMRVREWMLSSPRKPANQAFTAGAERNAAYLIEEYDAAKSSVSVEELIKYLCCNTNLFTNDIEEAAQAILAKYNVTVKG